MSGTRKVSRKVSPNSGGRSVGHPATHADALAAATRGGTMSARVMSLAGETDAPDAATLALWAEDAFANYGSFDGIPGVSRDPQQRREIQAAFAAAFVAAMRARLRLGG